MMTTCRDDDQRDDDQPDDDQRVVMMTTFARQRRCMTTGIVIPALVMSRATRLTNQRPVHGHPR